jgi:DNA-dependent RNA polymerase auxiliary subunit epsilon
MTLSDAAKNLDPSPSNAGQGSTQETSSRSLRQEPRVAGTDGPDVTLSAEDSDHSALRERVEELELRLKERVEESSVLDEEVRCLLAERKIRDEFIASMEGAVLRLPLAEQQLLDTDNAYKELHALYSELHALYSSYQSDAEGRLAEQARIIEAYRSRRSVRVADRLGARVRQFPSAVRMAHFLRRALTDRPTRH